MEEEMEMEIQIQMLPSSLSVSLGNMYGVKSCIGICGGCDGGVAVLGDGTDMEEGDVGSFSDLTIPGHCLSIGDQWVM